MYKWRKEPEWWLWAEKKVRCREREEKKEDKRQE